MDSNWVSIAEESKFPSGSERKGSEKKKNCKKERFERWTWQKGGWKKPDAGVGKEQEEGRMWRAMTWSPGWAILTKAQVRSSLLCWSFLTPTTIVLPFLSSSLGIFISLFFFFLRFFLSLLSLFQLQLTEDSYGGVGVNWITRKKAMLIEVFVSSRILLCFVLPF